MEIAGYIRVSTAKQRDQSDSPDNQEALLRSAGCTRIYRDLAVSGFSYSKRRRAVDFIRLLEDIRSGSIASLKTTRIDRIARRDQIFQEILQACEDHAIPFEALASGAIDTKTPSNWLNVKMQVMMAEFYSRQLSHSIKTAKQSQIARGIPAVSSASLPFHLIRDPATKHGVIPGPLFDKARECVLRITLGELSLNDACQELGQSRSTISRWIRRKCLCGHMTAGDGNILIRNCWPALISEAEQEDAIAAIVRRRARWGGNATRQCYALSGIVVCANCGKSMAYSNKKNQQYMRCTNQHGCSAWSKAARPHLIETELLVNHLLPHMGKLASTLAQPVVASPPELAEWKRELRYREATPAEYLLPHDRERIVELQGLIESASQARAPHNEADHARIVLMFTDVTFGEGSWFSRSEPDRNRDLRVLVSRVSYDVLMRRIQNVVLRVPD
jgi:DNA invertase Pin-like site-specific DNA recombinase